MLQNNFCFCNIVKTHCLSHLRIDKPTQNRDRPQAVAVFKRPFADRGGFSYRDGVTGKEELGLIRNEMKNHRPIQFDSGDGTIVNILLVDVEGFCSKNARAVFALCITYGNLQTRYAATTKRPFSAW